MDRVNSSDVEQGSPDSAVQASSSVHSRIISRISKFFQGPVRSSVEYPRGYPEFSAFTSEPEYQNFRRFKVLRTRMLLRKQDEIAQLESSLNEVDRNELRKMWLGYQRKDRNVERKAIFDRLEEAFSTYDSFLQRTHWAMNVQESHPQHMNDMRMWMEYHKCIEESEAAYLDAEIPDLMNVGGAADRSLGKLVPFAERMAMAMYRWWRKLPRQNSKSTELWIRPAINKAIAHVFAGCLAVTLLLVPVIILNVVQSIMAKFVVIFVAATAFISTLTAVSLAGMAEMFVAGATYTAVLVVFVSQNGLDGTK